MRRTAPQHIIAAVSPLVLTFQQQHLRFFFFPSWVKKKSMLYGKIRCFSLCFAMQCNLLQGPRSCVAPSYSTVDSSIKQQVKIYLCAHSYDINMLNWSKQLADFSLTRLCVVLINVEAAFLRSIF